MVRRSSKQEFVVIGLGRFGSNVALRLEEQGHTVLGIDRSEHLVQHMADHITQAVALDATNEDALRAVDMASFGTAVVAIGSDFESNVLTTVALKSVGVRHVICKAPTYRQRDILLKVGADRVIQPEIDAGRRLADELATPNLLEKLTLGPEHSLVELLMPPSLAWKSLVQLDLRQKFGVSVLLVKRGNDLTVSPRADFVLNPDDVLVVLGRNERIARFAELS